VEAIATMALVAALSKMPLGMRRAYIEGRERCFIEWGICQETDDPTGGISCRAADEQECDCQKCDPEPPPNNHPDKGGRAI